MPEKSFISKKIGQYIENLIENYENINAERQDKLSAIARYISEKKKTDTQINFIFICTHNSRRSHISQLWAQAAAYYYGIERINCYSGGTEVTAFNYRAVAAMKRAGFSILPVNSSENPHYSVSFSDDTSEMTVFSKEYGDAFNPQSDYIAVMTCADADQNCPIVQGAAKRFSLPYTDPKESDDTDQEEEIYDLRCRQIATEMFLIFSKVKGT